jgi:hypothetical protein
MPEIRRNPMYPLALSPARFADALHVSQSTRDQILTAARSGDIPVFKCGTRRLILIEDALTWFRTTFPTMKPPKLDRSTAL